MTSGSLWHANLCLKQIVTSLLSRIIAIDNIKFKEKRDGRNTRFSLSLSLSLLGNIAIELIEWLANSGTKCLYNIKCNIVSLIPR